MASPSSRSWSPPWCCSSASWACWASSSRPTASPPPTARASRVSRCSARSWRPRGRSRTTQLTQNTIVSKIQALPGLADSSSGSSGWTVVRRNITYTISVGTCSVDDSNDGTGPHESAGYCKDGTGQTTAQQCRTYLGPDGQHRRAPASSRRRRPRPATAASTATSTARSTACRHVRWPVHELLGHRHEPQRLQARRRPRALEPRARVRATRCSRRRSRTRACRRRRRCRR